MELDPEYELAYIVKGYSAALRVAAFSKFSVDQGIKLACKGDGSVVALVAMIRCLLSSACFVVRGFVALAFLLGCGT